MDTSESPPAATVALREVLPAIGFVEDWGSFTDRPPAFTFKGGGIDICVAEVMSLDLRRVLSVGGVAANGRTLVHVMLELPLEVESTDLALAWLVCGIGKDYVPTRPIAWFDLGRELQHLLPWEQGLLKRPADADELRLSATAAPDDTDPHAK